MVEKTTATAVASKTADSRFTRSATDPAGKSVARGPSIVQSG